METPGFLDEDKNIMVLFIADEKDEVLLDAQNQTHSKVYHKRKEIYPANGWDAIKLIDFLSYMPNTYSAVIKKTTIHDYRRKIIVYE